MIHISRGFKKANQVYQDIQAEIVIVAKAISALAKIPSFIKVEVGPSTNIASLTAFPLLGPILIKKGIAKGKLFFAAAKADCKGRGVLYALQSVQAFFAAILMGAKTGGGIVKLAQWTNRIPAFTFLMKKALPAFAALVTAMGMIPNTVTLVSSAKELNALYGCQKEGLTLAEKFDRIARLFEDLGAVPNVSAEALTASSEKLQAKYTIRAAVANESYFTNGKRFKAMRTRMNQLFQTNQSELVHLIEGLKRVKPLQNLQSTEMKSLLRESMQILEELSNEHATIGDVLRLEKLADNLETLKGGPDNYTRYIKKQLTTIREELEAELQGAEGLDLLLADIGSELRRKIVMTSLTLFFSALVLAAAVIVVVDPDLAVGPLSMKEFAMAVWFAAGALEIGAALVNKYLGSETWNKLEELLHTRDEVA